MTRSPSTLRNWGRTGQIEEHGHLINKFRLYERADLERLLWRAEASVRSTKNPADERIAEALATNALQLEKNQLGMSTVNGSRNVMERFGFVFDEGGVHLARTMMVADLTRTLAASSQSSSIKQFALAIEEENILGKRSAQSRKLALRHLSKLYGLDSSITLFRAFCFLWDREEKGRPLLCLLLAYSRDAILRSSVPFIFDLRQDERFEREQLEAFIDGLRPGRFSKATLKSTAQNLAGTWTQSGHLVGKVNKVRRHVNATPANVALALLLGFIAGERGQLLFESEYIKLLDCHPTQAMELAETAANKGWINFKRVGSIMEVTFPRLLTQEEREWIVE